MDEQGSISLDRLGLTSYEKQLVSSMVAGGRESINYREAMNISNVPYGKVHTTLNSLEEKGFLEEAGGRPKRYRLRPIGDVIEDYLVKPLLTELFGFPGDGDSTFRNIWIREVCSAIPVITVDHEQTEPPITMLSGIEEIRKAQIKELMKAKEEVLICFPRGNFLDRKFTDYLYDGNNTRLEIISAFNPIELMKHTFQSQAREIADMLSNEGVRSRIHFFINPNIVERFMVVDGAFAAIGSDISPVLAHIYSRQHCSELRNRFMELKKDSREIDLAPK